MRKPLLLLALASAVAFAGGINLDTAKSYDFTDCSASGSAAQTLTVGVYLLTVSDSNTFLCLAATGSTCVTGGRKLPQGLGMMISIGADQVSVSCRSVSATGDLSFTGASQ